MPILPAELIEYLANAGQIDLSLPVTQGVDGNVFPDLSPSQVAAGGVDYAKTFRKNTDALLTWVGVRTWIRAQPAGATLALGIGISSTDDQDPAQGNMTPFLTATYAALVSDGADTRNATLLGENATGSYTVEVVTLTGATPVLSLTQWNRLYAMQLASTDASRTVTVGEGSIPPARGTIPPNRITCWLWRSDLTSSLIALQHGDIAATGYFGLWAKRTWLAGVAAVPLTTAYVRSEGGTPP